MRSARELERQIRARVEKMQERRRNPRGTTSEQMAATEQDVEEVKPVLHYSHDVSVLNTYDCDPNWLFIYLFMFGCVSFLMIDEDVAEAAPGEEEKSGKRP